MGRNFRLAVTLSRPGRTGCVPAGRAPAVGDTSLARARISVSRRITWVVVALAAVLTVLWGATLGWLFQVASEGRQQALMHSARTIMSAAEAQLDQFITAGRVLVASPALERDDVATFEAQARRAASTLGEAWIVLATPNSEQIFNTRLPPGGSSGLVRSTTARAVLKRALATGQMQVSDVFAGTLVPAPIINITFPVVRDGVPRYALVIAFSPRVFDRLLEGMPDNWLAGLADSQGNYVARSAGSDELVGRPASAAWRETMHQEGVTEIRSRDGEMLINANMPSARTGWAAAVGVRTAALYRPTWATLSVAGLLGALAIGVCLAVLGGIRRRIVAMLGALSRAVTGLRRHEATLERTGEHEIDRLIEAFNETATELAAIERERAQHDRQMTLAAEELNHRSKNLLTVISGMARLIARDARDLKHFNIRFNARLQALARCQDLLIDNDWKPASLAEVVRSQTEPFALGRIDISGDMVMLATETIQPLSLLLHELATNAAKHGALSAPEGRVTVRWTVSVDAAGRRTLSLAWQERGGPAVEAPAGAGFGTTVIRETCVQSLGGTVQLDYLPAGLVCSFTFPLDAGAGAQPATETRTHPSEPLAMAS
jgi:two-component sensor histidine kinase